MRPAPALALLLPCLLARPPEAAAQIPCSEVIDSWFDLSELSFLLSGFPSLRNRLDSGAHTFFVPTDTAFAKLPSGYAAVTRYGSSRLQALLKHHILSQAYSVSDLQTQKKFSTEGGGEVVVNATVGPRITLRVGPPPGALAEVMDIECGLGGIIHVIDKVIEGARDARVHPDGLYQVASAHPSLVNIFRHSFMGKLATADADLWAQLMGPGPLTALMPSNEAFDNAPEGLFVDPELFSVVLRRHVLEGIHISQDFEGVGDSPALDGHSAVPWNRSKIGHDHGTVPSGQVRILSGNTERDIAARNGLLHVVDGLLFPKGTDFETIPTAISKLGAVDLTTSNADSLRDFARLMRESKTSTAVRGLGPFTCLIAADNAFSTLTTGQQGYLFGSQEVMARVFLYHVMYGKHTVDALVAGRNRSTLLSREDRLFFNPEPDQRQEIRGEPDSASGVIARLVPKAADTEGGDGPTEIKTETASNGLMHYVDKVLIPPGVTLPQRTVLQILEQGGFTVFHGIVKGLEEDEADANGGKATVAETGGTYTIFAFTDEAWSRLTEDERVNLEQSILLKEKVVRLCLTGGSTKGRDAYISSAALLARAEDPDDPGLTTLDPVAEPTSGEQYYKVSFNKSDDGKRVLVQNKANITQEIPAKNGVIHVIDAIIFPPDVDRIVHGGWGWEQCSVVTVQSDLGIGNLTQCAHQWQCYSHHTNSALEGQHKDGKPHALFFICLCLLVGVFLRHFRHSADSALARVPYELTLVLITTLFGALGSLGEPFSHYDAMVDMDPILMEYLFIPPLIFQSAFATDVQMFMRMSIHCVVLAGPGVIAMAIGYGSLVKLIYQQYNWNFMTSFLFGTIVSATDPVATGSLLQDLVASHAVSTMMTVESLFNSGTAIALYSLVKDSVITDAVDGMGWFVVNLLIMLLGGPAVGLVIANFFCRCLKEVFNSPIVEVASILSVVYITFYVCEKAQVSGALGVVALGLYLSYKESSVSPEVIGMLRTVLEVVTWFVNTLIFGLTGLIVRRSFSEMQGSDIGLVVIGYLVLNVVRGLMLALMYPAFTRLHGVQFGRNTYLLFTWGGLRGSVALVLALVVAGNNAIYCFDKQLGEKFVFQTAGIVILTLCINGMLAPKLVERFHLNESSSATHRRMHRSWERLVAAMEDELMSLKHSFVLCEANWNRVKQVTYGEMEDPYGPVSNVAPSQLEVKAEARESYFALFEQSIKEQFKEGLLLGSAHRILHNWASRTRQDERLVNGQAPLLTWDNDVWAVPRWKRNLCCWKEQSGLEVRRFGFGFNVLLGFIHAHDFVMQHIGNLVDDTVVVSSIRDHCKQVQVESVQMLTNITRNHGDISVAMRTKAAARHVLNAGRVAVNKFEQGARVSGHDASVLRGLVERQMKKIPKLPRSMQHPENDETLREWVEWYRADPQCMFQLSHLFRCEQMAPQRPEQRMFRKGSGDETRFFFVVLRGLVRVHYAGAAQLCGQGYSAGLLSSLTGIRGRFADCYPETPILVARFPATEVRHCTRVFAPMGELIWLQAGRTAALHCLGVRSPWRDWDRRTLERLVSVGTLKELVRGAPTHLPPGYWYVLFNGTCTRTADKEAVEAVAVVPERFFGAVLFDSHALVLAIPDPSSSQAKAQKRWQKIHQRLRLIRSSTWLQGFAGYKQELRNAFPDPAPGELEGTSSPARRPSRLDSTRDNRGISHSGTAKDLAAQLFLLQGVGGKPEKEEDDTEEVDLETLRSVSTTLSHKELPQRVRPAPDEVRRDADGRWYTRAEFVSHYGSDARWHSAKRAPRQAPPDP
eukprot:TRINITY_DN3591_c0_g1_i1.p1 TRINITY_DN3591_c0_g1~~TRINITY_DN3591_c0_g1_i1.p1  ORF type:complete len:1815 (+),score=615.63 TRINITY_DN3591_c0_g1_i1:63-5447(+)